MTTDPLEKYFAELDQDLADQASDWILDEIEPTVSAPNITTTSSPWSIPSNEPVIYKAVTLKKNPILWDPAPEEEQHNVLPSGVKFSIVIDSFHKNVDKAIYDPGANTVTIYLHDGFIVTGPINEQYAADMIADGAYEFPARRLVPTGLTPLEVRTCVHYTPARGSDGPTEDAVAWNYANSPSNPTCTNPNLTEGALFVACGRGDMFAGCVGYTPERDIDYQRHTIHRGDTVSNYLVKKSRRATGYLTFIVVEEFDDGESEPLYTSNHLITDPHEGLANWLTIAGAGSSFVEVEDLNVPESKETEPWIGTLVSIG